MYQRYREKSQSRTSRARISRTSKGNIDPPVGILDPEGKSLNPLTGQEYSDQYRELARKWSTFPAYELRDSIIASLEDHQVILVEGGTGSGKTVMLPKFALHYTKYQGNVITTIPKREITLSSAAYAAKTLDVDLGKEVGYMFSGAPKGGVTPGETKLFYATDGTLRNIFSESPTLDAFSVVIIDEAHERKPNIDLLLLYMKDLLLSGKRPDLRLVVMSATIDLQRYREYFDGLTVADFKVRGATNYPVKIEYLEPGEKADVVSKTRKVIQDGETGNIMTFVTSGNEAKKSCRLLLTDQPQVACAEMYAKMTEDHRDLATVPGKYLETGKTQKVIYATNMGESSLTVDDLDVVIDNGLELRSSFEPKIYASSLLKCQITQAQAIQRSGRVGRTHPGKCYRLYTEAEFRKMPKYPTPEILRSDITMFLLRSIAVTPEGTYASAEKKFQRLLDPPSKAQFGAARDLCKMYQLIGSDGVPTLNGTAVIGMEKIPIHLTLFMIYAYQFGCLRDACVIVSLISILEGNMDLLFEPRVPFQMSRARNQEGPHILRRLATEYQSDHLALWDIFEQNRLAPDREQWAKEVGVRLDLLFLANREAKKMIYGMKRLLFEEGVSMPESIVSEQFPLQDAIRTALRYSHLHLTAEGMRPVIGNMNIKIIPNNTSFLKSDRPAQEKMIIYNELRNNMGTWTLSVNTLIDPVRDTLPA